MLLTQWIRAFYSDNGTITDISLGLQEDASVTFEVVGTQDYLYVAQSMPFNNLFVEIHTANTNASVVSVDLWDGKAWTPAVDVLDGSALSGKSLARDGVIQFQPDRDEFWEKVEDTRDEPTAFGLQSSVVIYDCYFARFKFSADLSAGTKLKKIGYAFCNDEQLEGVDPEIDNYLTSWDAAKTDWVEQILVASLHLITDLKARGWISHPGQVLRLDDVSMAAAYRTLALIYNKLGSGFEGQRDDALKQYNDLLSVKRFTFDQDGDGQVGRGELFGSISRGIR